MVRMVRSCTQSMLKLVNSGIGMVGIALILYGVWLIKVWQRQMGQFPIGHSHFPVPWFIYASLGLRIALCVITCSGHIAAGYASGYCLYLQIIYMLFVHALFMLEVALAAEVFLNHHWEKKDFPEDPTGSFDRFRDFIRSNFSICKSIGLAVLCIQGVSLLLAMILKVLGPAQHYDCDDDGTEHSSAVRAPLLYNALLSPRYVVVDPVSAPNKEGSVRSSGF